MKLLGCIGCALEAILVGVFGSREYRRWLSDRRKNEWDGAQ